MSRLVPAADAAVTLSVVETGEEVYGNEDVTTFSTMRLPRLGITNVEFGGFGIGETPFVRTTYNISVAARLEELAFKAFRAAATRARSRPTRTNVRALRLVRRNIESFYDMRGPRAGPRAGSRLA